MNEMPEHQPGPPDARPSVDGHVQAKPSRVRKRTLRHLREILAKAGTAGAVAALPCCIGCDPAPPPMSCTTDLSPERTHQWSSWRAQWTRTGEQPLGDLALNQQEEPANLVGSPQHVEDDPGADVVGKVGDH